MATEKCTRRALWNSLFLCAFAQVAAAEYATICTGYDHTCMIRDDLTTVYWGEELHGALGNGAESEESIGDGEDSDGYSFGDEEITSELGDALIPVDFGTGLTAKSISCDKDHTCVILSDDTTMCWGSGKYGVLGYGNTNNIDDSANEMGDNLAAIDLGDGLTAKSVEIGTGHTCTILSDDSLKCLIW